MRQQSPELTKANESELLLSAEGKNVGKYQRGLFCDE